MNASRRHVVPGRGPSRGGRGVDLWRPSGPLPDPEPVTPAADAAVLVRSLGDPPLPGSATVAGHYVAAVVEKAAQVALALAASADLLVLPADDDRE